MSKLNPVVSRPKSVKAVADRHGLELAVSANGNLQFKKQPLQMLYELVVQTMVGNDGQLHSNKDLINRIKTGVREVVDTGAYDFIANLAIHARTEMNVRTAPVVLVVEFAKALSDKREQATAALKAELKSEATASNARRRQLLQKRVDAVSADFTYPHMRQLVCDVIQRADQITDLYAYALSVFGSKNKVPMALKRGVADACNKFGEYAFAKYNRAGAVKFRDVLRIVHPVAASEAQRVVFDKIMKDTLSVPYTWETELSRNGQLPPAERKSTKQIWTELVVSGKLGYTALLRNLRNIHEAQLDSDVLREHVYNVISDPKRVAASKQLPYDFVEAYNIVAQLDGKMATAVSKALDLSVSNIPEIGRNVWVIADFSGSMGSGSTSAFESATFLAAALLKNTENCDNVAVTLFGSAAKTLHSVDTNRSVLDLKDMLESHRRGEIAGSTQFEAALRERSKLSFKPDTVLVLTDGEINRFPYPVLDATTRGADVMRLTVNLSAAMSTPFVQANGWHTLAGWSPAMFKWLPAMRSKESAVDQLAKPYAGLPLKRPVDR